MLRKILLLFSIVGLLVISQGCKSQDGTADNNSDSVITSPLYGDNIQPIFSSSCALANCHSANSASGGLVLATGLSFANLVNVDAVAEPDKKRVLANDANNSFLIIKLEGRQTVGSRMPVGGTLSANKIQTIKNWINQGAENN